eukprot:m.258495 g.258495  ORF g.258495 m.258495 type:complete len:252 (-) comp30949_c0_seq1:771-1526(-)
MLAPALRRNRGHRAFHQLQQGLLHPLARHVAGDRGIVRLARDLVDLIDIDDAALRALDVVFRGLQQLQDDVLDILAHVAGFGQRGRIGHGERHIQNARQRLRQQRLAAAGRTDQQDVGLRQFDFAGLAGFARIAKTLVVVVDCDREHALGTLLSDHVIVQHRADIGRGRHAVRGLEPGALGFLADDIHAQFDAFIADEDGRTGDQFSDLVLALAAKGTIQRILAVITGGMSHSTPRARHRLRPSDGPLRQN